MTTPFHRERAFTLLELLVVVSIIGLLAGLAFPVFQSVQRKAALTRETQAARSLLAAYAGAAADRDGQFLAGYDRTVGEVTLPTGKKVSGPAAQRYPYRLAPYFSQRMDGTVLLQNAKQIDANNTYMVSCFPALGINYLFVGGDVSADGTTAFASDCVTRQAGVSGSPLVFASAAGDDTSGKVGGYCILTPPQTTGPMWDTAPWKATAMASSYGNIDARYEGKAVCGFLDGSVRLHSIEDLRDMRLWSSQAAAADDRDYFITVASSGGRR